MQAIARSSRLAGMGVSRKNLILASNPKSGRGRGLEIAQSSAEYLLRAGHSVIHLQADSDAALRDLLRTAVVADCDGAILVGGDGLVHSGINALAGQPSLPIGIIPAGTGNDIAMALGIPLVYADALDHLDKSLRRSPRRIDLGHSSQASVSARFAAVYSAGFDAVVNERANQMAYPKGPSRYTVALLAELSAMRPRHYQLEVDGEAMSREALLVAVANGPSFGGGMRVVPDASMTDGVLEVFIVGPVSKLEFLRIYPRVFSGAHVSHPAVEIIQARRVSIAAEGIVGYADGERQGSLPVTIEVAPSAIGVFA